MHAYDAETLSIILGGDDSTIESDDDIPTDPILAAYELPHLPGFEAQDEIVRKLQAEGKLFDAPVNPNWGDSSSLGAHDTMTFDPLRGVGMPQIKEGDGDGGS